MRPPVRVPSLSTPGDAWWVADLGGAYRCECPRASFIRTGTGTTCRHAELVQRADLILARCRERHGSEGDVLCRACLVELLALAARKVRKGYITKEEAKAKVARARQRRKPKPKEA